MMVHLYDIAVRAMLLVVYAERSVRLHNFVHVCEQMLIILPAATYAVHQVLIRAHEKYAEMMDAVATSWDEWLSKAALGCTTNMRTYTHQHGINMKLERAGGKNRQVFFQQVARCKHTVRSPEG